MTQEAIEIVRLGAGSFATIYVWQSRNGLAIKCVADPNRCPELQQEFEHHNKIHGACASIAGKSLFQICRPLECFSSSEMLLQRLRMDPTVLPNSASYTMQRAWPIPPGLSCSIREKYFPASQSEYSRPFIARIYLGRGPERSQQLRVSRFFNANNFPLDAQRCKELDLPAEALAQGMGSVLSRIHYHAGLNGRDIEFVLGGHSVNPFSNTGFYCFDFNQCKPHNGCVDSLVESFLDNDPYYPRPGMEFWDEFKDSYVQEAIVAPDGINSVMMARKFVDMLETAVAAKTAKAAPEGRGYEMALLDEALDS